MSIDWEIINKIKAETARQRKEAAKAKDKEYQKKYYQEVTKPKRKKAKEDKSK